MPKNGCVLRASWYGKKFHGRQMADGGRFDMHDATIVAHKKLPFGTRLWLTNQKTGRSIEVVVRDRGPYVSGRSLDLSLAAAEKLGFRHEGHALLTVNYVVVPAPKGASLANHSGRAKQFGS
jgi:rare lipoprotein A